MTGRRIHAGLRLLDRQIKDRDGWLCGNVDDLELTWSDDGTQLHVTAILSGPGVLASRLERRWGRWIEWAHARLKPRDGGPPSRIPFSVVADVDSSVVLGISGAALGNQDTEVWVRTHVIDHIPGARHDPPEE